MKHENMSVIVSDTDADECFFSSFHQGGNPEDAEAAEVAPTPGLPSHLSHHHREALLVNPEVQTLYCSFNA